MKLSTKKQQESYENAKICYICKEKFENKYTKDKKYCKFRDHFHYTGECGRAAYSIWNLKYIESKKISIDFHNRSDYDYHFIIREFAEESKKKFTCLGEKCMNKNTEKCMTFTVLIEKEVTRIDKTGGEITKKCLVNASSSSNLDNNLSKEIHEIKCRYGDDDKKCETCRITYDECDCIFEYANFKDDNRIQMFTL